MIYLIVAQDSKKRMTEVSKQEELNSAFWNYFLNISNHRNVLYTQEFFNSVLKNVLPNRVNVIFTSSKSKKPLVFNAICEPSIKQIITTYANTPTDDIYVVGDAKTIDLFIGYADFLIVYTTDELGYTKQYTLDTINFADFDFLKKEKHQDVVIDFYVKTPNYLGN